MNVHFFEPPPEQTKGGLDLAVRGLEEFLRGSGVAVRCNPPVDELGQAGVPEVAHFHGLWQPRFCRVSAHCRRRRIPYVVSPHGMLEPWAWRHKRWKKWPWFHLVERSHLAGAARLLATGEGEARNLQERLPAARCVALPLGLAAASRPDYGRAREQFGWTSAETVLLYLSRIHPKKGLHTLLTSLVHLGRAATAAVRLVIVGGGEARYVRELKAFAARHAAQLPRIDWVGEVWGEARWPYFQGADLFCLPSFSENFGLAILEALQVGTPVLTTDQTPWTDVPSWGAGFIVTPGVDGVRGALTAFLTRPRMPAERRVTLAAEIHDRFSWETVGPSYLRVYEELRQRSY